MAPSTPRREAMLVALQGYLDGVTAGATYFTTLTGKVFRQEWASPKEYPCVFIVAGEELLEEEATGPSYTRIASDFTIELDVRTVDRETTGPTSIEKLIHDVKKRLLIDDATRNQSGTIIDTKILRVSTPTLVESTSPVIQASIFVLLRSRYVSSDPAQQS